MCLVGHTRLNWDIGAHGDFWWKSGHFWFEQIWVPLPNLCQNYQVSSNLASFWLFLFKKEDLNKYNFSNQFSMLLSSGKNLPASIYLVLSYRALFRPFLTAFGRILTIWSKNGQKVPQKCSIAQKTPVGFLLKITGINDQKQLFLFKWGS